MRRSAIAFVVLAALLSPAAAVADQANLALSSQYALGVRVRGVFVPAAFVAPYLDAATSTNGASVGLEFIYRKPTYDVVTSLDMSFITPDAGNYLAGGHNPAEDTHYAQFHNLSFLSADVSIIGHHTWASAPWFELRYGAGLGLGLVLGDVLLTNDGLQCTRQNASDTRACYPVSPTVGPIPIGQPDTESKLKATEKAGATDVARDPHRHVTPDKPPVMVVLNVLMAVAFRVHRHASLQVEVGFRDAMFVGAGFHYWF